MVNHPAVLKHVAAVSLSLVSDTTNQINKCCKAAGFTNIHPTRGGHDNPDNSASLTQGEVPEAAAPEEPKPPTPPPPPPKGNFLLWSEFLEVIASFFFCSGCWINNHVVYQSVTETIIAFYLPFCVRFSCRAHKCSSGPVRWRQEWHISHYNLEPARSCGFIWPGWIYHWDLQRWK